MLAHRPEVDSSANDHLIIAFASEFCAEDLLRALATAVNSLISQHLPNVPRYTKPPTDLAAARNVKAGIELEDLINAGVMILFEAPDEFSAWQKSARLLIT